MLGGVPDGEREHRLRIRGIDDVDEVVVALRVVDRLDLDAQFVELCLGLLDSLRLLACVLRAQISKQHIFHGYLHVMWIVVREDLAIIRLVATSAHTFMSNAFMSNAFMSNAFMSNAFMSKSRLDSPRPGAIHVVALRLGQEATATVIRSSAACSWSRTGGTNWTAVRAPIEPFRCRRDQ